MAKKAIDIYSVYVNGRYFKIKEDSFSGVSTWFSFVLAGRTNLGWIKFYSGIYGDSLIKKYNNYDNYADEFKAFVKNAFSVRRCFDVYEIDWTQVDSKDKLYWSDRYGKRLGDNQFEDLMKLAGK